MSEQKYEYFQTGMSENGTIHIYNNYKKTGSVIYFFLEKGAYRIPGSAEKGAIRHAHPHYAIYIWLLLQNYCRLYLKLKCVMKYACLHHCIYICSIYANHLLCRERTI